MLIKICRVKVQNQLNAFIKAGQEGLSLKHLAEELGDVVWLQIKGDSSANDGILKRSGAGKVKHLSVRQLWLQERISKGDMYHQKIPRAINWADAMTHYFTKSEAIVHFAGMNCHRPLGSHEEAGMFQWLSHPRGGSEHSRCTGVPFSCACSNIVKPYSV